MGYSPAQSGLVDTYVSVLDLLAHANYTFEVEAVNGVSDLSRTQRLFAAVSIATGQAGERSYYVKQFISNSEMCSEDVSAALFCQLDANEVVFSPSELFWMSVTTKYLEFWKIH